LQRRKRLERGRRNGQFGFIEFTEQRIGWLIGRSRIRIAIDRRQSEFRKQRQWFFSKQWRKRGFVQRIPLASVSYQGPAPAGPLLLSISLFVFSPLSDVRSLTTDERAGGLW
jgi:hypothetical protein